LSEFWSIWHWGDSTIRLWIVGAILGILYPARILLEVARGTSVDTATLVTGAVVAASALGAAALVVHLRLAKRREARAALTTESFEQVKEQLDLRWADDRSFFALQDEARKSVRYRPAAAENVIEAFTLSYAGRDVVLYDLEQRRGAVHFRVLAATRLDSSYPVSSLARARLALGRRSRYPGVVLRGAAKGAPDELRQWVANQVPGTYFYTDGTWALCDYDSYLAGDNLSHIVRSLTQFAGMLDSGTALNVAHR
jgi:hypothetical protein